MSYGAILLDELMIDILSRLPAKSLCRFKCVSKSWFDLISSPYLVKTHLNRSINNKRDRILIISDNLYYSIDCTEASNDDAVIATKLDFPMTKDPDFIQASCDGLFLVRDYDDDNIFLLNPSIRVSKKLPKFPNFPFVVYSCTLLRSMYGIGYHSSADNYKVIAISNHSEDDDDSDDDDEKTMRAYLSLKFLGVEKTIRAYDRLKFVSVYSLKTNSWKRIKDFPYYHSRLTPKPGVFVNGSIHWLTRCSDMSPVIAAFDVADEEFLDVLPPSSFGKEDMSCTKLSDLGVTGGCLCMLLSDDDTGAKADLWLMKEYGMAESWTKLTISLSTTLYHIKPLCLLDREVLHQMDADKLAAYNAIKKKNRYITVNGMPAKFHEWMTYVESIVSLDYHRIGRKG